MPTYQYACTDRDCGATFERVQSFTDPAVSECPVCAQPVRKVYSAVSVVFKGSGFYRNDSRADARADSAKNGGKNGGKSATSNGSASTPDSSTGASGNGASKTADGSAGKASSSGSKDSGAPTPHKAPTPA